MSVLQSKAIEMEQMHIQMKDFADQLKEAQETFKKQWETIKLEAEVLCRYVNTVEHHLSELQTSNCALHVANLYRR